MTRKIWEKVNSANADLVKRVEELLLMEILPAEVLRCFGEDEVAKDVLQLMCSDGREAIWLANKGHKVTGVDFSEFAIKKANADATATNLNAEFLVADVNFEIGKFFEEKFDFVILTLGSLMWVTDQERFLINCKKYLKKTGKLIIWDFHPRILFDSKISYQEFEREFGFCIEKCDGISVYMERSISRGKNPSGDLFVEGEVNFSKYSISYLIKNILKTGFQLENYIAFPYIYSEGWDEKYVNIGDLKFSNPTNPGYSSFLIQAELS